MNLLRRLESKLGCWQISWPLALLLWAAFWLYGFSVGVAVTAIMRVCP